MDPYRSALHVLPIAFQYTSNPNPSIVDIGCGDGHWLMAAKDHHHNLCLRLLGVDRKPSHNMTQLTYRGISYCHMDLNVDTTLNVNPLFDLCICLEVAEHLQPHRALPLIELLTSLSNVVLFSAAPPGQGPVAVPGIDDNNPGVHHNEQPHDYWTRLFLKQSYTQVDITPALNTPHMLENVDPWYRDNATIYIKTA